MSQRLSRNVAILVASSLVLLATCCGGGANPLPVSTVSTPSFSSSSTTLSFGNQAVGTTSAAQSITLTNVGSATLTISGITVTGPDASDYISTNTCGPSVATAAQCSVSVKFAPSAAGMRTASVVFTDNAAGSPQTANLSGTGTVSFVPTGSLNTARAGATATLLNSGMVLIAGGVTVASSGPPETALSSAELYNPATGTFTPTGSLNTARAEHTATLLPDGMVLIAGGCNTPTIYPECDVLALDSAELFNPATGMFTPTGSMNNARGDHTATLLPSGLVLIAGGNTSNFTAIASAELYDPASGTFTITGSLNATRFLHTATLLNNGMVLMAGGISSDLGIAFIASAELYNPTTGTFTPTGSLNSRRFNHTATLLNSGMVLIAGGADGGYGNPATAELYDPSTGTFTLTGSTNTQRNASPATLLNNGMVLMEGGGPSSPPLENSAELYDPATGTFTLTGSLNTARAEHTATLLPDGMVLIAAGDFTGPTTSAELFEPDTLTPPDLMSIAVTPVTPTLLVGTTQYFIATGTFRDGSTQQLASVIWSSSNTNVAQLGTDTSNHGVGFAISVGTVTITATDGNVSGSTTLKVD